MCRSKVQSRHNSRNIKIKIQGCRLFLKLFDTPRELFLSFLESLAEDKTKGLERELHELRNTKLVYKR
jgi:hypothetical protein